jgi:beta-galactosidase
VGTLDRMRRERSLWLPERREEATLDLLVEAMGHVNFGPDMEQDRKGITERVELDEGLGPREVLDWEMFPIPLSVPSLATLKFDRAGRWEAGGRKVEPGNPRGLREPTFFRATLDLKELGDTFLDMRQWSKGVVWVNGHNLGRYWSLGPQQTLYLPGPWLKPRGDEIIVLDLLGPTKAEIQGRTNAILNELNLASLGRLHRKTGQRLVLDGVKPVAKGSFLPESGWPMAKFEPVHARYVCLEARSSLANDGYTTCAELNIVDAAGQNISKAGWKILYADSEEVLAEDASDDRVLDGRAETFWHTRWDGTKDPLPHHLVIDLGGGTRTHRGSLPAASGQASWPHRGIPHLRDEEPAAGAVAQTLGSARAPEPSRLDECREIGGSHCA